MRHEMRSARAFVASGMATSAGRSTSICGTVDQLTERVFEQNSAFGDQRETPYAVRVRKAFLSYKGAFKGQLSSTELQSTEIDLMWHQQFKSVEQAGEVLARLRKASNAHGQLTASPRAL